MNKIKIEISKKIIAGFTAAVAVLIPLSGLTVIEQPENNYYEGGDPLVSNNNFGADLDNYGGLGYPTQGFLFPIGTTQGYAHTPWVRYTVNSVNYSYRGRFDFWWDGTLWTIVDPLHIVLSTSEKVMAVGRMQAGQLRVDITASTITDVNWVLEEYTLTNTGNAPITNFRFYQFIDYDVGPTGIGSGVMPGVISENDDDVVKFIPELNALYTSDTNIKNPTTIDPLVMGMYSPLPSTAHDVFGGRYYANPAYYHVMDAIMNNRNLFPDPAFESWVADYPAGDGGGTLMWDFGTLAPGQSVKIPVYFFGVIGESLVGLIGNEALFEPPVINKDFALKDGTTVPLKFHLLDDNGNPITNILDVSLEITGPNAAGAIVTYTFYASDGSLKFDPAVFPPHYVADFNTKAYSVKDGGEYVAAVKVSGLAVGSISFNVFTASGTARGNSGK